MRDKDNKPKANLKNPFLEKLKDIIDNPKPLSKPPYLCPNTGDRRLGNGCMHPNCMCSWNLQN